MSVKTLQITVNDLQPYYYFRVKDSNGNVDLTGATLRLTLRNITTGTRKIDRATDRVIVTGAAQGNAHVVWLLGDTNTLGMYKIEIEITPSFGGKFTIPSKGETALVEIVQSQDTQ